MKYIQPKVLANSFTCPHCGAIAKQDWWFTDWRNRYLNENPDYHPLRIGTYQHCNESTLWVLDKLFYPDNGNAPFPNPEMPDSVKKLYLEASAVHTKSPRGAAALLRLAIQILAKELRESGKNINTDIGNLVKKGLPDQ